MTVLAAALLHKAENNGDTGRQKRGLQDVVHELKGENRVSDERLVEEDIKIESHDGEENKSRHLERFFPKLGNHRPSILIFPLNH